MIRFVYWCGVLRGRLKTLLNPRVTKQGQLRCGKSVKFDTNYSSGLIRFEGTAFLDDHTRFRLRGNGLITIGSGTTFNRFNSINCSKEIRIGHNCKFGEFIGIYDMNYCLNSEESVSKPIVIGDNVRVGSNSIIVAGAIIGDNSIIGAGVIVRGEVAPNCIYIGK